MIARSLRTALYQAAINGLASGDEVVIRTLVCDDGNPVQYNLLTAAGTRQQLDDLERDVRAQSTTLGEVVGVLDGEVELESFLARDRGVGRA